MSKIPHQLTLADMEDGDDYRAFVEKFKPKKTTDDCLTPPAVYDAIASWVEAEFGVSRDRFVRPFWPGGDYERHDYPDGCVVVDNPPFSILSSILRTYDSAGIDYFLFAPGLTAFTGDPMGCCHITTDCCITYENGAVVHTAFVTSLDRENLVRTAPDLTKLVNDVMDEILKKGKTELPKYAYPDEILTAARGGWLSKWGQDLRIARGEAVFVRSIESQAAVGKGIFGGGYLLSRRAAAERAAAERAAAERAEVKRWTLSERELAIVESIGKEQR